MFVRISKCFIQTHQSLPKSSVYEPCRCDYLRSCVVDQCFCRRRGEVELAFVVETKST